MKTNQKLEFIKNKIDKLNKRLIKRTFKVEFKNNGANNYCLEMNNESYKFNTYDDMINCLSFIDDMFEKSIKEIENEKESK